MYRLNMPIGNCLDCGQFARLDNNRYCPICANRENELLCTAQVFLRDNKEATRDEVAERLQIEVGRVERWMKSGKIRCAALKNLCPQCNRPIYDFSCNHCGRNEIQVLEQHLRDDKKQEINSFRIHYHRERVHLRFDRSRKRA